MIQTVKFPRKKNADFSKALKSNVNNYFKEKNLSKYGDYTMVLKTLFMLTLYLTPYGFVLSGAIESNYLFLGLWAIMGFGMSGIGLSVMHDATHGAYSKTPNVNRFVSWVIYLIGGNSINWRIQHNVLHHTYTNVEGLDGDIKAPVPLLRFSPYQPKMKIQRFQHIYAWFFNAFLTLTWAFHADFLQLADFSKRGLLKAYGKSFARLMTELVCFKSFYYLFVFILPMTLSGMPIWICVAGFFTMQFISGIVLASIFQPAHVVECAEFPLPDEDGNMENNWLIHQLETTTNFAQNNKFFTWFVGGLNHQVEHHLFPTICHIHYAKISSIVKETAEEYGVPYHSYPTFAAALINHGKILKEFGR